MISDLKIEELTYLAEAAYAGEQTLQKPRHEEQRYGGE